ncbi:DNA polymerase III subunit delta [Urechidicola sp. KH5]
MADVKQITTDIKNGNIKPIYFLMGEEPYYIDKIADFIENSVLTEAEKGFNQMVMYGRDTTIDEIVSNAKRFPMMAERQVIIVKEAQDLYKTIDQLESYAAQPTPSTVLVFCYKYKTLDKRKKVTKTIAATGVVFESKRLYENQVPDWIRRVLSGNKYSIDPKASHMLVEFLGSDLSKISNELNKLMLIIPKGETITPQHIEENIGISKDYNNFELQKAVGQKNIVQANKIIQHFSHNQRNHPIFVTTAVLYSFFVKLLQYHGLKDKTRGNVAKALRVNPYFVEDYMNAAKHYPMRKVSQIIGLLKDADLKSKGVGASRVPHGDILKETLFKILH